MRDTRHPSFSQGGIAADFCGAPYAVAFVHDATSAIHIHVHSQSRELGCLIGVSTPAGDDRGTAHVLEHMVMHGSAQVKPRLRAQVMRESLRTYTTAFTRIDWTGFAFASRSRDDFCNLLRVHADGVFNPILDGPAFRRRDRRNGADVGCHAIVLNEMRGILESPLARMWYSLARHLYAASPYRFNNCGVPDEIRACNLREVQAYHHAHYRPSGMVFVTHGDLPLDRVQGLLDAALMDAHSRRPPDARSGRPAEPAAIPDLLSRQGREAYPDAVAEPRTDLLVGWRLPRCSTLAQLLDCRLLAEVLFSGPDSPLAQALAAAGLGRSVAPLNGLEDGYPDPALVCGVVDGDDRAAERLDEVLDGTLHRAARSGFPGKRIAYALAKVQLAWRYPKMGDLPYWLSPVLAAARAVLRGSDAASFLAVAEGLADLERRAADPGFLQGLIRRQVLSNPNRFRLTLVALPRGAQALVKPAPARLQPVLGTRTHRTGGGQSELPPIALPPPPLSAAHVAVQPGPGIVESVPGLLWTCAARTHGVTHQQTAFLLNGIPERLIDLLPVTTSILQHAMQQDRRGVSCGALESRLDVSASIDDGGKVCLSWIVEGNCLASDFAACTARMRQGVEGGARIRLQDLAACLRRLLGLRRHALVNAGHRQLIWAAGAGLRPGPAISHRWHGIRSIRALQRLRRDLASPQKLAKVLDAVVETASYLCQTANEHLVVADAGEIGLQVHHWCLARGDGPQRSSRASMVQGPKATGIRPSGPVRGFHGATSPARSAWLCGLGQAGCAVAYGTVPANHPDSPALTVLAHAVNDGLIRVIARDSCGAYACGAGHDAANGIFHLFRFRDPDVLGAVDDLLVCGPLLARTCGRKMVSLAQRAALRALDPCASEIDDAKMEFTRQRTGRTRAIRQAYRDRLLAVKPEDLSRVAESYLGGSPEVAVLAPTWARQDLERRGFSMLPVFDTES